MNCSRTSALEALAVALVQGARRELCLTPKPGLVDRVDNGSHPDLSFSIMERSIAYVSDYLFEIVNSLANGEPFSCQKAIGMRADQCLLERLGTNTHKGFIFLSGMLLIARWHAGSSDEHAVRAMLSSLSRDFFSVGGQQLTNGQQARTKFNAGGIVLESINGFPSVFDEAVPTFRKAMRVHGDAELASFFMLARLMQTVEDTTTLHRAGIDGLLRIKQDGQALEDALSRGDDHIVYLSALNRDYIGMNLTIGGVADMLGIAYGYLTACGELSDDFGMPAFAVQSV